MPWRCLAAACLVAAAACAPAEAPGPPLYVDGHGWFVSEEPVSGRWYPAEGVRLLVPHETAGLLYGRLEADSTHAKGAEFATLDAGGVLQYVELRRAAKRSPTPLGPEVRRALAAELDALPGSLAPALAEGLRGTGPEPSPVPDPSIAAAQASHAVSSRGSGPPAPGAPLAAWAPRQFAFARFRSVEAGYRIADTLDDLVARVLAEHGDARDAATLRLTLFHLLLPTIWRTNPGVTKGVSEMGLVVAPPYARGPLTAAVLLRIDDPVRHEMHTKAAVAIEAKPNHLWRPVADPFPAERERRSVRRVVGDIEVVATDGSLLASLAAGVSESWADDAESAAFLSGPGEGAGHRAVAAVFPPGEEVDLDERLSARAARGVAHVLAQLGVDAPGGAAIRPRLGRVPLGLRRIEIRTDRAGAHLRVVGEAADELHGLLVPGGGRSAAACRANCGDASALALIEGPSPDPAERTLVLFGYALRCPASGTLRTDSVTRAVSCSVHESPIPGAPSHTAGAGGQGTMHQVEVVRAAPGEVTIVIPIDWSER